MMFRTLLKRISTNSFFKESFRYLNSSVTLADKCCQEKGKPTNLCPQADKEKKPCNTCDISECPHIKKEIEDKKKAEELKQKEKLAKTAVTSKAPCAPLPPEKDVDEDLSIEPLLSTDHDDSRVVIIGAGAAGIAAAKYLEENNIKNYVILEALGRLGGRIQTEWFGDTVIELGAMCPKGSNEFPKFLQMAMADGIVSAPITHMSIFSSCEGRSLNPSTSLIAYEIFRRIYCESLNIETDRLDYINFRMEQELLNFPGHVKQDAGRVMLGLLAMLYRRGDNLQFINREGSATYLQSPVGSVRVPLGYYGTLQSTINQIPPEKIKLNKPVQNIRWGAVVCKDTPRALIKCTDGSVYPAEYVIITVSLGVLKANADCLFCPALPADKVEALNTIGFQHVNHIYFRFAEPFWSWTKGTINLIFKENDLKEREDWTRAITQISQVPGSNNVLFVRVAGEDAECFEKIDPLTVLDSVLDIIKDKMQLLCAPCATESIQSAWSSNVFFNGAYSYLSEGICDDVVCKLSGPLPGSNAPVSPILFFAGEATCPKLYSTVQGAKISGIREASRIQRIIVSKKEIDAGKEQRMAMTAG